MPSRYRIRELEENGYYHIFHRGIEKRKIFLDEQDHQIFLYYLKVYLLSPKILGQKYSNIPIRLQAKNLSNEIELISYCLMPNHFHLLLKQVTKDALPRFMKQILNAYTFYYNEKYTRSGPTFEGRYKAVRIPSDTLLLHVSRYIHLNPVVANLCKLPQAYKWSSYMDYLKGSEGKFIKSKEILDFFSKKNLYEKFTMDQISYGKKLETIKHLTID